MCRANKFGETVFHIAAATGNLNQRQLDEQKLFKYLLIYILSNIKGLQIFTL